MEGGSRIYHTKKPVEQATRKRKEGEPRKSLIAVYRIAYTDFVSYHRSTRSKNFILEGSTGRGLRGGDEKSIRAGQRERVDYWVQWVSPAKSKRGILPV